MCHCHVWWEGIASNWPFEWGSWYLSIGIRGAPFSTWDAMRCLEWNAGQWDGEATVPDFTSRFKKPPCFRVMRQPTQHLCTTICMCCSKQTCTYISIWLHMYIRSTWVTMSRICSLQSTTNLTLTPHRSHRLSQ
jgi:hypothetical protein